MRGLFPLPDLTRALADRVFGPGKPRPTVRGGDLGPALGGTTVCWCGRMAGHDWPGKEIGAAHPREDA